MANDGKALPKSSKLERVEVRFTKLMHVAIPPVVGEDGKGLVLTTPTSMFIKAKNTVWADLGVCLHAPARLQGLPSLAVQLGLVVTPDVFYPGERIIVAVSNVGEFMVELPRGTEIARAEPVLWRLGEVSYVAIEQPA